MALAEHQKVLDEKEGRYLWDLAHPSGYGNRMGRYRTQVELEFLFRHLPAARSRVLDVGGGSGRLGAVMSARGHEVTLLDKNPQALALAAGKGLARTVQADFRDFAEKDFGMFFTNKPDVETVGDKQTMNLTLAGVPNDLFAELGIAVSVKA